MISWQIKYVISPLPQWLWLLNLAGWFYTVMSLIRQSRNIYWSSCKLMGMWQTKYVISLLPQGLVKVVSYYNELPPIKSDNPLNTWSFEITWHIKNVLSPLPQCLKPPKLAAWWPIQCDKFKALNLIYHSTYCTKLVRAVIYLLREALIFKAIITWSCDFDFLLRNF